MNKNSFADHKKLGQLKGDPKGQAGRALSEIYDSLRTMHKSWQLCAIFNAS